MTKKKNKLIFELPTKDDIMEAEVEEALEKKQNERKKDRVD